MDYTVRGILQARILEWAAFPFSRESSQPRSSALQADSLQAEPQGKPKNTVVGSLSLLQHIFPTQELNQDLLHCRRILYQLSYEGSIYFVLTPEVVCHSSLAATRLLVQVSLISLVEALWCNTLQSSGRRTLCLCLGLHMPDPSLAQLCLTLCDPTDCSPPDSSVHGILQARILQWGAISYSRASSPPRDWTCISCLGRQMGFPGGSVVRSQEPLREIPPRTRSWGEDLKRKAVQATRGPPGWPRPLPHPVDSPSCCGPCSSCCGSLRCLLRALLLLSH